MPATKHCCYGICRSDSRYFYKDHMKEVHFIAFPKPKKNSELCERWVRACGRAGFTSLRVTKDTYICSLHFVGGKGPTTDHPDPIPASYNDEQTLKLSKKRKPPMLRSSTPAAFPINKISKLDNAEEFVATHDWAAAVPLALEVVDGVDLTEVADWMLPVQTEVEVDYTDVAVGPDADVQATIEVAEVLVDEVPGIVTAPKTREIGVQTVFVGSDELALKVQLVVCQKELEAVKLENYFLKEKLEILVRKKSPKSKVEPPSRSCFGIDSIKDDPKQVKFYTGLTFFQLTTLWHFLGPAASKLTYYNRPIKDSEKSPSKRPGPQRKLTPLDELFLTLVRLRLGLLRADLAYRFGISQTSVSKIVITWIQFMFLQFKCIVPQMFPERAVIQQSLPSCFKKFRNTRCIIDCTEFFVQQARNFAKQGNLYSSYKGRATYKALIGICPTGAISFVSDIFEGSISDRQIVIDSGFTDRLVEGDIVMADRGFNVIDVFLETGVILFKPPHLNQREKLTSTEEAQTKVIAKLRIHVERAIERIKKYRLLQKVIPLSLEPVINQILFVCCCLVNFQEPLVA